MHVWFQKSGFYPPKGEAAEQIDGANNGAEFS